jgi:hypothetical protein
MMPLRDDLDVRISGADVDWLTEVLEYLESKADAARAENVRQCIEMLQAAGREAVARDRLIASVLGEEVLRRLNG